jgi:phenolic acid decarboxylase
MKDCFQKKNGTIRSAIYLDKKIVNTPHRRDYILNDFIPKIEALKKKLASIYGSQGCLT